MTAEEKMERFRALIAPDTIDDPQLLAFLQAAGVAVLDRRFPYGWETEQVPDQYASLQVEIAVEMWSHKGAEGEIGHSENGVSRSWASPGPSSALLNRIVPLVGSVRHA